MKEQIMTYYFPLWAALSRDLVLRLKDLFTKEAGSHQSKGIGLIHSLTNCPYHVIH